MAYTFRHLRGGTCRRFPNSILRFSIWILYGASSERKRNDYMGLHFFFLGGEGGCGRFKKNLVQILAKK